MTMAIRPITNADVRFGESVDLERNGAYTEAPLTDEGAVDTFEKSGSTKKVVLGTLGTLVVAAAALAGLAKGKVINELSAADLEKAGFFKKIPHYLAKAGNWIADNTYGRIMKLFKNEEKAAGTKGDAPEGAAATKKPNGKKSGGKKTSAPKKTTKPAPEAAPQGEAPVEK